MKPVLHSTTNRAGIPTCWNNAASRGTVILVYRRMLWEEGSGQSHLGNKQPHRRAPALHSFIRPSNRPVRATEHTFGTAPEHPVVLLLRRQWHRISPERQLRFLLLHLRVEQIRKLAL